MIFNRVIPSLLLRQGRLVKGTSFSNWRDAGNPVTTARALNAQKADELLLLDIDASPEARGPDLQAVEAVARECRMPLTAGGGIDSVEKAGACLYHGADKIFIGAAALAQPQLIGRLAATFGSQAVVVGIDVIDGRLRGPGGQVLERGWLDWLREVVAQGAGEIRLCAVGREGSRQGFDLDLWRAARAAANLPMILEGGGGDLESLAQAMAAGVDSLALGTMIVFSDNNIIQIKRYLKNAGHAIRI